MIRENGVYESVSEFSKQMMPGKRFRYADLDNWHACVVALRNINFMCCDLDLYHFG